MQSRVELRESCAMHSLVTTVRHFINIVQSQLSHTQTPAGRPGKYKKYGLSMTKKVQEIHKYFPRMSNDKNVVHITIDHDKVLHSVTAGDLTPISIKEY